MKYFQPDYNNIIRSFLRFLIDDLGGLGSFGGLGLRLLHVLLGVLLLDDLLLDDWLLGLLDLRGLSGDLVLLSSGLLLGHPGVVHLLVAGSGSDSALPSADLVLLVDALPSQSLFGDESLDLGGLLPEGGLGVLLALEGSPDHVLLDECGGVGSVTLGDVVELADVGGSLGAESAGLDFVSESRDLLLALLGDGAGEHLDVGADDAAANGLPFALSLAGGSVAGGAGGEQELDSAVGEDALFHGEPVAVEATGDLEDVALELFTEGIGLHLLSESLLKEVPPRVAVVDHDALGRSLFRTMQTELR